ncbi:MAG TPA: hypothetical protein VMS01_15920, partial [Stellaceae bacterium]|nr:hypothetical protein [Stellaceae bacterium]
MYEHARRFLVEQLSGKKSDAEIMDELVALETAIRRLEGEAPSAGTQGPAALPPAPEPPPPARLEKPPPARLEAPPARLEQPPPARLEKPPPARLETNRAVIAPGGDIGSRRE